jgi:hypothetical protein
MPRVLIEINGPSGRLLVDDVDLSNQTSAINIEYRAGDRPLVHLTMIATELTVTADDAQVESSGGPE